MQKRGLIVLVLLFLIAGFAVGYYLPVYQSQKQQRLLTESSYSSKAWDLFYQGNYEAAIEEFNKYIKRNNQNFVAYHGLGQSYFELRDYSAAINAFNSALGLRPSDFNSNLNVAWSKYNQGDYGGAISAFNKAKTIIENEFVYVGLGLSYYKLKDYTKAQDALNNALKVNPDLSSAAIILFMIEYETNKEEVHFENLMPFKSDNAIKSKDYKNFYICMVQEGRTRESVYECGKIL